jgi:hypothetical protein
VVGYVKDPEIHHKILSLDRRELNEEAYKTLLEKNTADEMRIRDLLEKRESVEETLRVLEGMDPDE